LPETLWLHEDREKGSSEVGNEGSCERGKFTKAVIEKCRTYHQQFAQNLTEKIHIWPGIVPNMTQEEMCYGKK
jgi:hypothetical protein